MSALYRSGVTSAHARLIKGAVTLAAFVAVVLLHGGAGSGIWATLLATSVTGLIDSRFCVTLGLVCLSCCPILLIADQHAWLQQSPLVNYYAVNMGLYSFKDVADILLGWAFFLLCIGLAGRIARYVRHERRDDCEAEKIA